MSETCFDAFLSVAPDKCSRRPLAPWVRETAALLVGRLAYALFYLALLGGVVALPLAVLLYLLGG